MRDEARDEAGGRFDDTKEDEADTRVSIKLEPKLEGTERLDMFYDKVRSNQFNQGEFDKLRTTYLDSWEAKTKCEGYYTRSGVERNHYGLASPRLEKTCKQVFELCLRLLKKGNKPACYVWLQACHLYVGNCGSTSPPPPPYTPDPVNDETLQVLGFPGDARSNPIIIRDSFADGHTVYDVDNPQTRGWARGSRSSKRVAGKRRRVTTMKENERPNKQKKTGD